MFHFGSRQPTLPAYQMAANRHPAPFGQAAAPTAELESPMILSLIKLIICIAGAYLALSAGCEYRSYQGGHKFIKAFPARTPYQRLFTKLQCEKDISKADMGKLTYLGYAGVLIATIAGIFALPVYLFLLLSGQLRLAEYIVLPWGCLGMGWGGLSALLTGIDSLINQFF